MSRLVMKQITEEDDDNETLRDGESLRVSMLAMDSMDPLQRAIALSTMRLSDGFGRIAGHRPGFVYATDSDEAQKIKQSVYDAYETDLTTAWQRQRDSVVERDPMGREEATYTKRKQLATKRDPMGREAAEYEREPSDDEWEAAGPLSDAQSLKDAAYAEYERELADRWKGSK